jgi:hypothetical protein
MSEKRPSSESSEWEHFSLIFGMIEQMPVTWFDVATDARKAANRLVGEQFRSRLNRAYYAVYAKVTFDLSTVPGVVFPAGDEGLDVDARAARAAVAIMNTIFDSF